MKTKIKILIVSCVMAAAAFTGFNMAQISNNMDLTLADIAVMARANGGEGGGMANKCCPIWNVTITYKWSGPEISCSTGGVYKCEDCTCPS